MSISKFKLMVGTFGAVCIAANGFHEPIEIQVTLPPPADVIDSAVSTVEYISEKFTDAAEIADMHSQQAAYAESTLSSDRQTIYRIRNSANEASSQIGAYYDLELAKSACPKTYCIFDSNGALIYRG